MRALTTPITIVTREVETANRLDIEAFTVDAVARVVTIVGRGVQVDVNGAQIGGTRLPEVRVGDGDVYTLMAAGAQNIAVNVLTALGIDAQLIAQVVAGCAAHPQESAMAYYDGTRDALYDALASKLGAS